MKFLHFETKDGKIRFGLGEESSVLEIEGDIFGEYKITQTKRNLDELRLLPPCFPTKIIAVGLNYRDHAEEMKKTPPEEPILFMKPSTPILGHEGKIIYPKHMSSRVDYEGELAVVIGKKAKWVEEDEAFRYIFGYTCINDIT